MTEVLFYHLKGQTLEQVLPSLLQRSLERGWRVVVQGSSAPRHMARGRGGRAPDPADRQ
jgi:DNA polymerase-3 subunit chi